MMNLLEIIQRGQEKVKDLMDAGVAQEYIEIESLNRLCDEILGELGKIERYDDVKRAMMYMFFFGQVSSIHHFFNNPLT